MTELNNIEMIEIINSSPNFSDTTPKNEVELGEGQSVSTSLAPDTAETQQDEFKDEEKRTKAGENENLSFEETNNSSDNQSEVEVTVPKGKRFDISLLQKVSRQFIQSILSSRMTSKHFNKISD